jgi:hypothetical protein
MRISECSQLKVYRPKERAGAAASLKAAASFLQSRHLSDDACRRQRAFRQRDAVRIGRRNSPARQLLATLSKRANSRETYHSRLSWLTFATTTTSRVIGSSSRAMRVNGPSRHFAAAEQIGRRWNEADIEPD